MEKKPSANSKRTELFIRDPSPGTTSSNLPGVGPGIQSGVSIGESLSRGLILAGPSIEKERAPFRSALSSELR
jgi:hypothetical protein